MKKRVMSLIDRFVNWLRDPFKQTWPCDCGQEKNGVCTRRYRIYGAGVYHQCSARLLKCGKVKQQIQEMSKLNINDS